MHFFLKFSNKYVLNFLKNIVFVKVIFVRRSVYLYPWQNVSGSINSFTKETSAIHTCHADILYKRKLWYMRSLLFKIKVPTYYVKKKMKKNCKYLFQDKWLKTCIFVSSETNPILSKLLRSSKTIFRKSKQPVMILTIWKDDVHCSLFLISRINVTNVSEKG